jgi:hypothetical protein
VTNLLGQSGKLVQSISEPLNSPPGGIDAPRHVFNLCNCVFLSQNRISGTFFTVLVRSVSKIEYEVIESALPKSSKVEHIEGVAFLVHPKGGSFNNRD